MLYNEFLIFMTLSLNVYLYNMHIKKKKQFCACTENDCKKMFLILSMQFWHMRKLLHNCQGFFLEGDVTKEIFRLVVKEMLDNRVMRQCDQGKLFAIGLKKKRNLS